jgi:hypothetical protein
LNRNAPVVESAAEVRKMPDLSWLFEIEPGTPGAAFIWLVGLATLLFVGSLTVFISRRSFFPNSPLAARIAQRLSLVGVFLSLLLILLLGARYLSVPFIQMRFWLVLAGALIVAYAIYVVYFVLVRYPKLRATYDAEMKRQRYTRPQRPSSGGQRRSKKKRR